ncbi:ATP synthase F1 subunit epsilon [Diplocloster agilis]|uniref:ATP synthase epsilon chain n=1 Tax=Diplocloster agilis TaxID=2850323 RepID=A0A949K8A1_9FIRM|nr:MULTISPECIES: ATP synthase F1 subunit epsilon [Lachnospiraceae]MBU9738808.1 ATP synthase F1 subunit epsilon [Diplocloster agilis]MBU9745981.1 ATP synthase F1 subunit epsilon [Diplocloster agilis]MCU6735951.1 ATP synthase F1 subunit epsilon [Suonthocola fibrivorans]SCJ84502.1 F-ATPase epsilon subunit [uncultured Clostridium sp.]
MADDRLFRLEIISPDRVFYQGDVAMVELTTSEGDVGIYKNHIPMTMIVVPGIVTITEEEGQKRAALHSGFIEVLPDKVTILAELAEWPDEIDLNRAEEARVRAQRRLETGDSSMNMIRANMALRKALVRIELAEGKQK